MRVLIVEDDKDLCEILKELISQINPGIACDCTTSAHDTVAALKICEYDLLLLDYILADGVADPVLKFRQENCPNLPVLLVSASQKAALVGQKWDVTFLPKPFDIDILFKLVNKHLPV